MTVDLYALDASSVEEAQAIVDLFEDRERYDKPFTAKLTSFIDGLLVHFPDAETDPDGPWSNDPRQSSMVDGRCCEMNMRASLADDLYEYILTSCKGRDLYVYEDGQIIRPDTDRAAEPAPTKRRWWQRRPPD